MRKYFFLLLLLSTAIVSCKKQTETLPVDDIANLYPLKVGKVFIYRLDSTRLVNRAFATAYYLAKDTIESTFLDIQGRTAFRIFRYITDTLESQPYVYSDTYYAVITNSRVEYVDNNKRFITLANPASLNNSWLGNTYLGTDQLPITNNTSYDGWNYQYIAVQQPYTVIKGTFPNTVTVQQADNSFGTPNSGELSSKTYSIEVYANGVGLIYKEFMDYFYQTTPTPAFEDNSYGIKLNLVDYK